MKLHLVLNEKLHNKFEYVHSFLVGLSSFVWCDVVSLLTCFLVQNVMPLSAGLFKSERKNPVPQCPPRLHVQFLTPVLWSRVPNHFLKVSNPDYLYLACIYRPFLGGFFIAYFKWQQRNVFLFWKCRDARADCAEKKYKECTDCYSLLLFPASVLNSALKSFSCSGVSIQSEWQAWLAGPV